MDMLQPQEGVQESVKEEIQLAGLIQQTKLGYESELINFKTNNWEMLEASAAEYMFKSAPTPAEAANAKYCKI